VLLASSVPSADFFNCATAFVLCLLCSSAVANKLLMLLVPFLSKWTYARMHEQVSCESWRSWLLVLQLLCSHMILNRLDSVVQCSTIGTALLGIG
jgi:hypothetical protein